MVKHSFIACGGTFDLFHKGHELFLKQTLASSEKILIGITSNKYIKSFKNNLNVEDFEIRKQAVEKFLKIIGSSKKIKIVSIDNAFEPYLETSIDYDAISVTPHTLKAAQEINVKRKQNGISELDIILTPFLKAKDGDIISSTRIRNGEINRDGRLYINPIWKNKNLILPEKLRNKLQSPWGRIVKDIPEGIDDNKTVVVGDACALFFNKKSRKQFLSIIDFLIKREERFKNLSELGFDNINPIRIKNPSGIITAELFVAIKEVFVNNRQENIILIDGEDDLAVLPIILIAPLGFNIFYGQPNVGMVYVKITEELKEKAYNLISKFIVE